MEEGNWQQMTYRRRNIPMPSSPWSLPVKPVFRNPRLLSSEGNCSKEDLSLVEEHQVRGHLNKLVVHKSMGPNRLRPNVQWELAFIIMCPLFLIFEWSWQLAEAPEDWKSANTTLLFKKELLLFIQGTTGVSFSPQSLRR